MTTTEITTLQALDIDEISFEIEDDQNYYLQIYNTYLQFMKDKDNNINFWVHEYLTPKNERGYQVFFSYIIGEKEFIKSVGYGVEASDRTNDWKEVINEEI